VSKRWREKDFASDIKGMGVNDAWSKFRETRRQLTEEEVVGHSVAVEVHAVDSPV